MYIYSILYIYSMSIYRKSDQYAKRRAVKKENYNIIIRKQMKNYENVIYIYIYIYICAKYIYKYTLYIIYNTYVIMMYNI